MDRRVWISSRIGWVVSSLVGSSACAFAGGLRATAEPVGEIDGSAFVRVSLEWKNAWRNERNHDAAWIVLRDAASPSGAPLRLAAIGAAATENGRKAEIVVANDGIGAFIAPAESMRGDVEFDLLFPLGDGVACPDAVRVDGVEMVHVPAGSFDFGDDAFAATQLGAAFEVGEGGRPKGPYRVRDESAIEVGGIVGALAYAVGQAAQYRGDVSGPIPESYPKGTRAFYVMKYETRQGDYAAFLNALPRAWQERRCYVPNEKDEDAATWSIARDGERFVARAPERPCNFLSWDDSAAYLDWLGLRPLSEFEFEKAARGPTRPCPGDFPWGSADASDVERRVTRERDLGVATIEDERELDDPTKARFAASYGWVMDLSGSLWERVVTIGHPKGREFVGSHGDGVLDAQTGDATNPDWPRSGADPKTADGIGYRGGAEYFAAKTDATNPFSLVATRTYAAWNGAYRYKTYSARGCRLDPR